MGWINTLPHELPNTVTMSGSYPNFVFTTTGENVTATLDPLDPTMRWTLRVYLLGNTPTFTAPAYISFQHQSQIINPGVYQTYKGWNFTYTPGYSNRIELIGFPSGIKAGIALSSPDTRSAFERVRVYAYTPSTRYNDAVLGKSILGSFNLPQADFTSEWTLLNRSTLGYSFLVDQPEFYVWNDITSTSTQIEISRATHATLAGRYADVGTCVVTFISGNDPRAAMTVRGTPIIISDCMTRQRLFTGTIDTIESEPLKDGGYIVKYTILDRVAALSATTEYQHTEHRPADYPDAFPTLTGGHPTRIITRPGVTHPQIGQMVKEASTATWLDNYAATANVSWFINNAGEIIIDHGVPERATRTSISIQSSTPVSGYGLDPVAVTAKLNTADIISTFEIENHGAQYNSDEGEWEDTSETFTVENPALIAQYGRHVQCVTTCGDTAEINEIYAELLRDYTVRQVITDATFLPYDAAHYIVDDRLITELVRLELSDPIHTTYRNSEENIRRVTSIRHTITPRSWTTSLGLDN